MVDTNEIPGHLHVGGHVRAAGGFKSIDRGDLNQEELAKYVIDPPNWRVHDSGALLPTTPAADDLGLVLGTFGTDVPTIQTEDLKAAGATNNRARTTLWLPPEYVAQQSVRLRFSAGMLTTVADTSATLDVEVYESDTEAAVTGAGDLYSGAALDINSLTLADVDFELDASTLAPGDRLDVRITTAVNDAASGTAVKAVIAEAYLLCDIKG